jgi:hypothetical protein
LELALSSSKQIATASPLSSIPVIPIFEGDTLNDIDEED